MEPNEYDATFEKFLSNIALTQTQANKIDTKVAEMFGFFMSAFDDDIRFYIQGSYATGTTVKPLTENQGGAGEFDVDIVIERENWTGAVDALKELEELIESDSDYKDLLVKDDPKESCIRLEYQPDSQTGVGFHVDIVPILAKSDKKYVARRTKDSWGESDSEALIKWTKEFQDAHPYSTSALLSLKRLRDVKDYTTDLTSIVLLAILKKYYRDTGSYFNDILNVLSMVNLEFSKGLDQVVLVNPINSNEDLLGKWRDKPSIFINLSRYLALAHDTLKDALQIGDTIALREVLSTDFPSVLTDTNVDSLRMNKLQLDLSGKLRKGNFIRASAPYGKTTTNPFTLLFFERSKDVTFIAEEFNAYQTIYWQVNNARGPWNKRGDLFSAMAKGGLPGSSENPAINHESEEHLGSHWIRYFAVSGNKVQVISEPFTVKVLSSGTAQRPNLNR